MIKQQTTDINKIMDGSTQINRAYLNGSIVFGSVPMPLEVFATALTFTYKASSQVVKVKGENWTVTKTGEWVSVSPVSGDGTGYLTISVTENEVIDTPRSGSVVVSSNGVSATISISQDGAQEQPPLPDVQYFLNINAKSYDGGFAAGDYNVYSEDMAATISGLTAWSNDGLIFNYGNAPTVSTDHLVISPGTYINLLFPSVNANIFNIISESDSITFVFKVKTTSGENIIGNRNENYNYMIRQKSTYYTIHLASEGNADTPATYGDTEIISYTFSGGTITGKNWTTNQTGTGSAESYRSGSSYFGICFGNYPGETWGGDFHWMYISPGTALTDEEIQDVIDFNEN